MESSEAPQFHHKKRLSKTTLKRSKGLPKKVQDLSKEELLLTLQKKAECNAKALKIVERLLEPNVDQTWFLEALKDINQSHLQDVTEERAITKLCGYPLCSNELKNIPSQQYRISTKVNKVYDIKERKNFCSNRCFKACKFIKDQMHTSPLWLRDIEPTCQFVLLPSTDCRGGVGDEVPVQVERVSREEVKKLSRKVALDSSCNKILLPEDTEKSLADLLNNMHVVASMQGSSKSFETDTSMPMRRGLEGINEIIDQLEKENETEKYCISKAEEKAELDFSAPVNANISLDVKNQRRSCAPHLVMCKAEVGVENDSISQETVDRRPEIEAAFKLTCSKTVSVEVQSEVIGGYDGSNDNMLESCIKSNLDQNNRFTSTESNEEGRSLKGKMIFPAQVMEEEAISSLICEAKNNVSGDMKDSTNSSQISTVVCNDQKELQNLMIPENKFNMPLKTEAVTECKLERTSIDSFSDPGIKNATNMSSNNDDISQKCMKGKRKAPSQNRPPRSVVSHVEKCVQEWFTMETMYFLLGESALKDLLEQKGESIKEHYKYLRSLTWDQEKHERFLAICKRLSLLEMEDSSYDNQLTRTEADCQRKPLPDYEALKKEAESMELKVKAFYKGKTDIDTRKVSFAADVKAESSDVDNDKEPQLPLVHLHSQRALRKRIVLEGLNRVLPDFLRTFGLRPSELSSSVRGLIGTFALSPKNITFKPQEWSLLGLIIIKLLSLREVELKQCLDNEQSSTYLTLMLMSYKQEPGYLDRLLSWLTDVDLLLSKQSSPREICQDGS